MLVRDYLSDGRRALADDVVHSPGEAELLRIDTLVVGLSRVHHLQSDDLVGGDVHEAVCAVMGAVSRRVVAAVSAQDERCSHLLQQSLTLVLPVLVHCLAYILLLNSDDIRIRNYRLPLLHGLNRTGSPPPRN